MPPDLRFEHLSDGTIGVTVDSATDVFNHALADSVSSRAPALRRQAVSPVREEATIAASATDAPITVESAPGSLSTYWIDQALAGAQSARTTGSSVPFLCGNITYLRVVDDRVVAGFELRYRREICQLGHLR
jgi:hypothetical protein